MQTIAFPSESFYPVTVNGVMEFSFRGVNQDLYGRLGRTDGKSRRLWVVMNRSDNKSNTKREHH